MNRYYDYEPVPSCGIGKHPGTHTNGKCTRCDAHPAREARDAIAALVKPSQGKHRKADDA